MKRYVYVLFIAFVALLELIFLAYMALSPSSEFYSLASKFSWDINPFWVVTTLATIIFMADLAWGLVVKNYALVIWQYKFLAVTAWVWIFDLVIYETVMGRFHITKIVDAVVWLAVFFAARYVYKYDREN